MMYWSSTGLKLDNVDVFGGGSGRQADMIRRANVTLAEEAEGAEDG